MAGFEDRLDAARVLRVHRSHIVNFDHVEELSEHDDRRLELRMRDGASVVASRWARRSCRIWRCRAGRSPLRTGPGPDDSLPILLRFAFAVLPIIASDRGPPCPDVLSY